jgi:hypothetical protein
MNSPEPNPFSSLGWEALLAEMHERKITDRDSGAEWDLLVEEFNKHTGPTPYYR